MGMVWLAEALNTAIEELCDHVTPDRHAAIGRIKDLAAGAVLIASIAAGLIGALTLGPPLVRLL
jgi:diacylglycerol kinase (ATP)